MHTCTPCLQSPSALFAIVSVGNIWLTCIEYKSHTLARVEEDDGTGTPTVVPLELHSRAVVCVVGEVEEDLILCCAGHGCGLSEGVSEAQSWLGQRGGLGGDRSNCGEEDRRQ